MRRQLRWIAISTRACGILLSCLLVVGLLAASGCGSKATADAKKKELEKNKNKKKEKPKPAFDAFRVFTEPNEKSYSDPTELDAQTPMRVIKPGHWTGVLVETRANNFDFSGDMSSAALDSQQNPIDLERSIFRLSTARPAALPKGQRKSLEALFFAPPVQGRISTWMSNRLRGRGGNDEWRPETELLQHMPSYQYFMLVLARDASRYRYLKVMDSVRPPTEMAPLNLDDVSYYRIVAPRISPRMALPTQSLCWTSTACVIWDDLLPTALLPEHQQALLDWLHWGGQLIVSGPQSLDSLRGSFLEPYLPALSAETTKLETASLAELNKHWSLKDERGEQALVQAIKPWAGVKLALQPGGTFIAGTGELVAHRRAGAGRVVATAFRLSEPELLAWRSYDSFFNACMLNRPRRTFDGARGVVDFLPLPNATAPDRWDPELSSHLRYFTRDSQLAGVQPRHVPPQKMDPANAALNTTGLLVNGFYHETDMTDQLKSEPGVAAWDDFSAASDAARQTLREAAGIAVPKREFVLWMLGIYLALIVPVNWCVFRLLGRVEWAWIAVPVVAVVWGLIVIWMAQLDIGFARAETDIAVLELQGDFTRAHLTRYSALYSSLSTSYDVHLDDPTALAQPFSADVRLLQGQAHSSVTLRSVTDRELTDFLVSSNSTGMVHSEQMFNLNGSLRWTNTPGVPPTLENATKMKLSGAVLLRRVRGDEGKIEDEACWLGDLVGGASVDVHFVPYDEDELNTRRDESEMTSEDKAAGGLSLRRLVDLAQSHHALALGDVRLVAWTQQPLKGLHVSPAAANVRQAALVVAHLEYGPGLPLQPDLNLRRLQVQPVPTDDVSPPKGAPTDDVPSSDDPNQTPAPAATP